MRTTALLFVVPLLALGCADARSPVPAGVDPPAIGEPSDSNPNEERLTLRAGKFTFRDVRLEGERLWGPRHEIEHFPDGYRGQSPYGFLYLSEKDAGRVTGIIGARGALTNVSYEEDPQTHRIVSDGRWAAAAFGLEVSHEEVVVKGRFCTDHYRRVPDTDVFHGTPDCWRAGRYGADIHIPEAFFKRPAGEQVVFLSAFLAG